MSNVNLKPARLAVGTCLLLASLGVARAESRPPVAAGAGHAQAPGPQTPGARGPSTYIGPGVKGQMGSTRNDERWAAAKRKAAKRAEHVREHGKGT